MQILFAATILWSALLLFFVQPMMAKVLLPWFGGSAGVWTTCMLFFQVVLLLGYVYAHWLQTALSVKAQKIVHIALLLSSLLVLPISMSPISGAQTITDPVLRILMLLTATVGLPYFLLSTTSPLLQSWYSQGGAKRFPYRLFAISNAGSLLALLCYPLLIEPRSALQGQLLVWSGSYGVFVILTVAVALLFRGSKIHMPQQPAVMRELLLWLALAACASTMWLSIANHLSQDVAAVPLLWILPLSLYLLTFILCFESDGWYNPRLFRWLTPVAWVAIGAGFALGGATEGRLWPMIVVFNVALFICCMFCHGELARRRPAPAQLTGYYLSIASGGALGGIFVGLLAPRVFHEFLELPIALVGCIVLALGLLYGSSAARLKRLALTAVAGIAIALFTGAPADLRARNFYGGLQVTTKKIEGGEVRELYHGTTQHGCQWLSADRSRIPTTYYGRESGVGRALMLDPGKPQRIGVIGLGAGPLAAYGKKGDTYRFYEINPLVLDVAEKYFRFLQESPARMEFVVGDARLSLEGEPDQRYDVLVVDAFSGDAIPVHLLTQQAFRLYRRQVTADGIIAVHITNRYLDLAPVVQESADSVGLKAMLIHNDRDAENRVYTADWMILTNGAEAIRRLRPQATENAPHRKVRLWTDEYSSLFEVLKR